MVRQSTITILNNGNVNVYDSLYDTVDQQTKGIITSLFGISGIDIVPIHK